MLAQKKIKEFNHLILILMTLSKSSSEVVSMVPGITIPALLTCTEIKHLRSLKLLIGSSCLKISLSSPFTHPLS